MYLIEFAKAEKVDLPTGNTAAEKLEKLRACRERLNTMEPLQRIRGSLDQWICYDLAGGVFVSVVKKRTLPFQPIFPSNEDYWNAWEERPSIQAQAISTETLVENDGPTESVATIQVIHLPNPHTDEGLKHQVFQLKSFLPQGIAIDPGQDLLVLLEIDMQPGYVMHLRIY